MAGTDRTGAGLTKRGVARSFLLPRAFHPVLPSISFITFFGSGGAVLMVMVVEGGLVVVGGVGGGAVLSRNSKHWFTTPSSSSTTAVFSYAIGFRKLSANEQFFCWCSDSSKFVTNNSNKTRRVIYSRQQSLHQHK